MTWWIVGAAVGVLALVLALWAWRTATRIDRLHRKVLASRLALEAQLIRRAVAAAQLAGSGGPDPVTSLIIIGAADEVTASRNNAEEALLEAVPDLAQRLVPAPSHASRPSQAAVVHGLAHMAIGPQRVAAENALTLAVREALSDPALVAHWYAQADLAQLLDDLAAAWYRAQLARRFHNESVAQVRHLRRKTLVSAFRLAGHAPMPQSVDIDDAWPGCLHAPDGAATDS